MNSPHMHQKLLVLLQETHLAFIMLQENGGHPNADFEDFAAQQAIHSFRDVLKKPDLCSARLAEWMRDARRKQGLLARRKEDWMELIASSVGQRANLNTLQ